MTTPTRELIERLRRADYPQSPHPVSNDGVPLVRDAADTLERIVKAWEAYAEPGSSGHERAFRRHALRHAIEGKQP
jgi:hypothetical protein